MERSVKVGLITTILLIAIGGLILWKSDFKYFSKGYRVVGKFNHIGGLRKGAEIRYRGYKIGRVSDIRPSATCITADLWIDRGVEISKGSVAKIMFDGIVGENYVGIIPNPSSKELLKPGDVITGTTSADLSNFLDIGSQNLTQVEEILEAFKHMLTASTNVNSVQSTLQNFDKITTNLNLALERLNDQNSANAIQNTLANLESFSERLNNNSKVLFEDGQFVAQLNQLVKDLNVIATQLKNVTGDESSTKVKNSVANVEAITSKLNKLIPSDTSQGTNIIRGISKIHVKTEASVKYSGTDKNAYYNANVNFQTNKYFVRTGFGTRIDNSAKLNLQQGIKFNNKVSSRLGLFYNKTGIGLDVAPTQKAGMSVDVYKGQTEKDNWEVDITGKYSIRNDLDVLVGVRKDETTRKLNVIDTGLQYQF